MRHLLLHPEPVPALFVLTYRSESAQDNALVQAVLEAASDNRALSPRKIEVGPLSHGALTALASRLLDARGDERLARTLAAEAGGSPFFVAQLAHAALLRGEGATPPTLDEALAAHIDALPPPARRLLSVLALAGQPLPPAIAIDAAGLAHGHELLDGSPRRTPHSRLDGE